MTDQKDSDQQPIDNSPPSPSSAQAPLVGEVPAKPAARRPRTPKSSAVAKTPVAKEASPVDDVVSEPDTEKGKKAVAEAGGKPRAAKSATAKKTAPRTKAAKPAAAKKASANAEAPAVSDTSVAESDPSGAMADAAETTEAKPRARTSGPRRSTRAKSRAAGPQESLENVSQEGEVLVPPARFEPAPLLPVGVTEEGSPPVSAEPEPVPAAFGETRTAAAPVGQESVAASKDIWGSSGAFPYFGDETFPDTAAGEKEEHVSAAGGDSGERKRRSRSRRGRRKHAESRTESESGIRTENGDAVREGADASGPAPDSTPVVAEAEEDDENASPVKVGRRKMFVSVLPGEQIEVVITEESQVLEYYVEMLHQVKTKGNIYKATIHNVDPNLQAAFVSYGAIKNGFLQIDEVHPEYYNVPHDSIKGRKYPLIQKVLKPGQEVLVQVVKEPAGTKGAFLTTYLSLAGRFVVLTPGREQIGVSRKVEQEGERSRLRELLEGLSPGAGLGVIVRTVSMGASKSSLQKDLQFLKRLWKEVRARGTTEKAPSLVYQEMDLTTRAVRDYLTDEVAEVWVDDEETAAGLAEVAGMLFPRKQTLVREHKATETALFERFNLQRQLDQIHSREVSLPSGGQLVIDATEALTAIDINSGRSGGKSNFEDMAFRTNMEAARMIPLQLRLRDIGGQIVADFIEMRDRGHWREVEKTLRQGMKVDRARYDVGKIGPFGMLEIVRQRLGSSAISISSEPCPYCKGTGVRRNLEWRSQQALREIQKELRAAQAQNKTEYIYAAELALVLHLLNSKRQRLLEMEQNSGIRLEIRFKQPDM